MGKNKWIKSVFISLAACTILFGNTLTMISAATTIIDGSVIDEEFSVTIPEEIEEEQVVLNFSSNPAGGIEYDFFGDNYVFPGTLIEDAPLKIINETGEEYAITGFEVSAVLSRMGRLYGDVAISAGLTKAQTAALSADEWYQMNVDYFGEENLTDLDTLQVMFGYGNIGQGDWVGLETSPEMIDLAYYFLYNKTQLSFNNTLYPVSTSDVNPTIAIWNLMSASEATKKALINEMVGASIGDTPVTALIGYSTDYLDVGNAYGSAQTVVRFSFHLEKVNKTPIPETPNPENPEVIQPQPTINEEGPVTGDQTNLTFYLVLTSLSGIVLVKCIRESNK